MVWHHSGVPCTCPFHVLLPSAPPMCTSHPYALPRAASKCPSHVPHPPILACLLPLPYLGPKCPCHVALSALRWVRSVAVDPGNEWFATGSADRTIKIWDLASGQLKLTLTGHIEQVNSALTPSACSGLGEVRQRGLKVTNLACLLLYVQ